MRKTRSHFKQNNQNENDILQLEISEVPSSEKVKSQRELRIEKRSKLSTKVSQKNILQKQNQIIAQDISREKECLPQQLIPVTPQKSGMEMSDQNSVEKLEMVEPKPYYTDQKLVGLKRGGLEFPQKKLNYGTPNKSAKIEDCKSEISCQEQLPDLTPQILRISRNYPKLHEQVSSILNADNFCQLSEDWHQSTELNKEALIIEEPIDNKEDMANLFTYNDDDNVFNQDKIQNQTAIQFTDLQKRDSSQDLDFASLVHKDFHGQSIAVEDISYQCQKSDEGKAIGTEMKRVEDGNRSNKINNNATVQGQVSSSNAVSKTNNSSSEEDQSKSNSYEFVKIFNEDSREMALAGLTPKSGNLRVRVNNFVNQCSDENLNEDPEQKQDECEEQQNDQKQQKKPRKTRSDKNKRRKHPHRKMRAEGIVDSQRLLLMKSLGLIVDKEDIDDSPGLKELGSSSMLSMPQPPQYEPGIDYYKEYFRLYLQNENLVADIDQTAHENFKADRKILNIKDFYDNTLIPQIMTQPHKFLHRLRQQQYQIKQQKLVQEAQEKQLQLRERQSSFTVKPMESTIQKIIAMSPLKIITAEKQVSCAPIGTADQLDDSPITAGHYSFMSMGAKNKRKKHVRRSAHEIDRSFVCPYEGCDKFFGSEGSQNLHIKIKHNGGTKTDRERLARQLVEAYAESAKKTNSKNVQIDNDIIDKVELNLPPGILTQMARKSGLLTLEILNQFNEEALLDTINKRLAPKFREMICKQQELLQGEQCKINQCSDEDELGNSDMEMLEN